LIGERAVSGVTRPLEQYACQKPLAAKTPREYGRTGFFNRGVLAKLTKIVKNFDKAPPVYCLSASIGGETTLASPYDSAAGPAEARFTAQSRSYPALPCKKCRQRATLCRPSALRYYGIANLASPFISEVSRHGN
jgi:hypothetical protein